jgi:hypothetical protein
MENEKGRAKSLPFMCGTRLVSGTHLIKIRGGPTTLPFVSLLENYVHVDINLK